MLFASFFTADYVLMTVGRVILFGLASTSWAIAIARRSAEEDDGQHTPIYDYVSLTVIVGTLVELCTYVNYKQSAELFLTAKINERQQLMLQCMFDALPDSIMVCPKTISEEAKITKLDSTNSKDQAKTLKPLYMN